LLENSDSYHASVVQNGEQIELGIYTYDQLRNIIVRTVPKYTRMSVSDILSAAIARDGTFEIDNWRITILKIQR
jgi:hypothetical protein